MRKFLIRREMEGAGSIAKHELNNAGKGSEEVLEAMRSEGKNIIPKTPKPHKLNFRVLIFGHLNMRFFFLINLVYLLFMSSSNFSWSSFFFYSA